MVDRVQREKEFHNQRFSNEVRQATVKYYKIAKKSNAQFRDSIFNNCLNKQVLEIGCSKGSFTREIAGFGAMKVYGVDISEVAISEAKKKAESLGLENVEYFVKDGASLDFPEKCFDIVCGGAILHHLDFEKALIGISKILKTNGSAVFLEPLGHNPFINLYRKLTPKFRSEDESPLTQKEMKLFGKYFGKVEIKYYYLLTLLTVPFYKWKIFYTLVNIADSLDKVIFKMRFMKKFAWQVVIVLKEPKQNKQ